MDASLFADRLRQAYDNRKPIPPLRDEIGMTDLDFAYQIQNVNTYYRMDHGAHIVGKKIGLTSPSVQAQLGVDQPDYGILFDDMEVLNGGEINTDLLMQPKAEAEIAFVLAHDLDSDRITTLDIIQAIDYALPAIEIVGSRIADWNIKITDTIADNASASHYVIGHTPKMIDQFDMVNCKMNMTKNGSLVSSGSGKACLGSPINAMLWLARKMVSIGRPLRTGELIFTGALGPMTPIIAGDEVHADFEGLGTVSVRFN